MKISKRTVDAATAGSKDAYLWEDDLPGFGVKITPAGTKTYFIQYRMGGRKGRTRRVTIGRHGVLTPDQARLEAKRLLGEVAAGRDPAEDRDRAQQALSVGEALDRFLDDHVAAKLKGSTAGEYRRLVRLYFPKKLRSRPLIEVQRSDIERLHLGLRDKPYQANRLIAVLSKFFNWAEKHDWRPDGTNPCRHIQKYRERKRERFLSEAEFERLGEVLAEAEERGTESPWIMAAYRLLILTGARLGEIRQLRWDEVDLERRLLRLQDSKTGQKTIYLSEPAVEVLRSVPRLPKNPFVICGERPGACMVNLQKPWRRLRARAGLDDVRIHDLRHSFASVAAAQGLSLPVIGALLGHSQPATTARYAHLAQNPLTHAVEEIQFRIASSMSSRHNGGK